MTYLFSSHHADRFASEQVADELRNEGAAGRANRAEDQPGEAPPPGRVSSVASALSLCERDAELGEVFARGGQIVPDDGHVLLDVHDDRRHVGTLVAHVLHALPRHLGRREEGQRGADGTSASRAKHTVAVEKEKRICLLYHEANVEKLFTFLNDGWWQKRHSGNRRKSV